MDADRVEWTSNLVSAGSRDGPTRKKNFKQDAALVVSDELLRCRAACQSLTRRCARKTFAQQSVERRCEPAKRNRWQEDCAAEQKLACPDCENQGKRVGTKKTIVVAGVDGCRSDDGETQASDDNLA